MNYGIILAGGVGQRMRNTGLPKQFLEVYRKPILIYTLEKCEQCTDIDAVVVVCNAGWLDYAKELLCKFGIKKVIDVVCGGKDRQKSIENGVLALRQHGAGQDDIIVIHDGVRPMVSCSVISENVRVAVQRGCAMTVSYVTESVVVTEHDTACFSEFMRRDNTYSLTSPQTFRLGLLEEALQRTSDSNSDMPLLDAAMACASMGHEIPLVKDSNKNLKITTPEDYYFFKALIELEENRSVFGL